MWDVVVIENEKQKENIGKMLWLAGPSDNLEFIGDCT
jgi:hypothetical protein